MFFPAIAWTYFFLTNINQKFNLETIRSFHSNDPIYYIIDIFPFFLAGFAYFISLKWYNERKYLYNELLNSENLFQKYSGYIKKIGQGEFEELDSFYYEDELGESLKIMRDNLLMKTKEEETQLWITNGKNSVDEILRRNNEIKPLSYEILTKLIEYTDAVQGIFYVYDDEKQVLTSVSSYAYGREKFLNLEYQLGEGIIGQASYEKAVLFRKNLPEDFITLKSGILGEKKPKSLVVIPLIGNEQVQGALELAFLKNEISPDIISLYEELSETIGIFLLLCWLLC